MKSSIPHTLIVGGSSGTGLAVASLFVKRGHRVSVVGRRPKPVGAPFAYFRFDLTQLGKIPGLLSRIVGRDGEWSNLIFVQRYRGSGDAFKGEWTVGVEATQIFIEEAARRGTHRPRSIVIFNSVASEFVASSGPGYHAAKGALRQLMRYYAVHLGAKGIRVNSVSPATIAKTPRDRESPLRRVQASLLDTHIPLGRMGTPCDMAAASFLLCSSDAAYITGHDLRVDGGISALAQEALIRNLSPS